jgi:SAM-dependent methyltransferase
VLLLWQAFAGIASAQVVPYVPTPLDVVERMLGIANVGMDDYLVDLGSGDGRLVREAARRIGARGTGIEHDPELVARSTELARRDGVAEKTNFLQQDLFEADFSSASVVTMYLLPAVNLKLRPKLLSVLRPGTRVVSHDFDMGAWAPDATAEMYSKLKFGEAGGTSRVFMWVVPADVAGRWQWRMQLAGQTVDYELRAVQRYQKVEAQVRVNGEVKPVRDVTLRGDALTFTVVNEVKGSPVRQEFKGRVNGEVFEGSALLAGVRFHGAAEVTAPVLAVDVESSRQLQQCAVDHCTALHHV